MKRTNAELLAAYAAKSARLRRIEAAKGDPRIAEALQLARALRAFDAKRRDNNTDGYLDPAADALEGAAAQWVDEFFAEADGAA